MKMQAFSCDVSLVLFFFYIFFIFFDGRDAAAHQGDARLARGKDAATVTVTSAAEASHSAHAAGVRDGNCIRRTFGRSVETRWSCNSEVTQLVGAVVIPTSTGPSAVAISVRASCCPPP